MQMDRGHRHLAAAESRNPFSLPSGRKVSPAAVPQRPFQQGPGCRRRSAAHRPAPKPRNGHPAIIQRSSAARNSQRPSPWQQRARRDQFVLALGQPQIGRCLVGINKSACINLHQGACDTEIDHFCSVGTSGDVICNRLHEHVPQRARSGADRRSDPVRHRPAIAAGQPQRGRHRRGDRHSLGALIADASAGERW